MLTEPLPDSAQGFARFYKMIYGRPLPRHARQGWVEPLYAARAAGKGLLAEAFRGSAKTTTLTIAFTAFRLGHEPHKSALIIQVSNAAARTTVRQIADLIEHNPGWKDAFPDVVPDKKAGWANTGFEVKRTDMGYEEWRATCSREKGRDPSLIGLGYRSSSIIGRHPTGILVVDDIHDEANTRSRRQLERVLDTLTGTIQPAVMPGAWQIFVGTPWTANDALATMKATGEFVAVSTPVYRDTGRLGKVSGDYWEGKELTWPEFFGRDQVERARRLTGEQQFARMYLLDLNAAEGLHLKREWLGTLAHERIDPQWPVVLGVDYASTSLELKDGRRRDYFALAIGREVPNGGIVLVDGYRGRVSQGEAQQKVMEFNRQYRPRLIGVESIGKGEEFFNLLHREAFLPLAAMHTGRAGKSQRFEGSMAPLFEHRKVLVSDAETAFLRSFREEWLRWPNGEHDDTLDAVYWMLNAAQGSLFKTKPSEHKENPLEEFGRK